MPAAVVAVRRGGSGRHGAALLHALPQQLLVGLALCVMGDGRGRTSANRPQKHKKNHKTPAPCRVCSNKTHTQRTNIPHCPSLAHHLEVSFKLLGARELLPAEAAEAQAPLFGLGELVQLRGLVPRQALHAGFVWVDTYEGMHITITTPK